MPDSNHKQLSILKYLHDHTDGLGLFFTFLFSLYDNKTWYRKFHLYGCASLCLYGNSGDCDGRVPVIGSRYCVEALGLPLKSSWRSWFHKKQVIATACKHTHTRKHTSQKKQKRTAMMTQILFFDIQKFLLLLQEIPLVLSSLIPLL